MTRLAVRGGVQYALPGTGVLGQARDLYSGGVRGWGGPVVLSVRQTDTSPSLRAAVGADRLLPGPSTSDNLCRVPDAHFAEPRLADLYDPLDPDRGDLAAYVAIADEFDALTVLDIGCGTGTLACLLAQRAKDVTGVDPAAASPEVARRKPYADRVRWILGDCTACPALQVDKATMTGNVAQVFLTDEDWMATLSAARNAMRPGGLLVFESRDPARQEWREWTGEHREVELPQVGTVETWGDLVEVNMPFVSFRTTFVFASDGAIFTSDSTLRFRESAEVMESLHTAGFVLRGVRDAPDRPGREFVFMASAS